MYSRNRFASILFSFIGFIAVAQTDMPTPPPPMPPPPPGLPIDNGTVILFVLALVYGIFKAISLSRQTKLRP